MPNAKHIRMIEAEFAAACEKHPKFCDVFAAPMSWESIERSLKTINSNPPYCASELLDEEVAEAMVAHQQGDREHCLQELAQCGAVILRMMQFVEETKWAHQGEGK